MKTKSTKNATNWFLTVIQSWHSGLSGSYVHYRIFDNKLILVIPDYDGSILDIQIIEILHIVKLYEKYKKCTDADGNFNYKHEQKQDQFFNDISKFEI